MARFWRSLGASGLGQEHAAEHPRNTRPTRCGHVAIDGRTIDEACESAALAAVRARHSGSCSSSTICCPEFTRGGERDDAAAHRRDRISPARARACATRSLGRCGLTERWQHRPAELSGGEAQRVRGGACAGRRSPSWRSPTSRPGNLDRRSARTLHELMSTLARERHQTFVIVTHNDRLAVVGGSRPRPRRRTAALESDER